MERYLKHRRQRDAEQELLYHIKLVVWLDSLDKLSTITQIIRNTFIINKLIEATISFENGKPKFTVCDRKTPLCYTVYPSFEDFILAITKRGGLTKYARYGKRR